MGIPRPDLSWIITGKKEESVPDDIPDDTDQKDVDPYCIVIRFTSDKKIRDARVGKELSGKHIGNAASWLEAMSGMSMGASGGKYG